MARAEEVGDRALAGVGRAAEEAGMGQASARVGASIGHRHRLIASTPRRYRAR